MEPENISLEKEVNIDPNHQVLGSSRQFPGVKPKKGTGKLRVLKDKTTPLVPPT